MLQKNSDFEKNFVRALPDLHDFSGCDLTSAFHGIDRRKWLNIVKGNKEYLLQGTKFPWRKSLN